MLRSLKEHKRTMRSERKRTLCPTLLVHNAATPKQDCFVKRSTKQLTGGTEHQLKYEINKYLVWKGGQIYSREQKVPQCMQLILVELLHLHRD